MILLIRRPSGSKRLDVLPLYLNIQRSLIHEAFWGPGPYRLNPGPTPAQPPTRKGRAPPGSAEMLTGPMDRDFPGGPARTVSTPDRIGPWL